jgi:sigma-B regulation protein RsbU (phosphoserine phosphatase)
MPAALYMALTRSLILAEARREASPRQVLRNVNRLLLDLGEPARFVTVFYGVVDAATGRLTYTRAGHDYPLLLRNGDMQLLGGRGAILGVMEEDELELSEERLDLSKGDRLVLYTDGMCDVLNPQGEFFELHRLQGLLRYRADLPLQELCAAVFAELHGYQGNAEQFDDMTLLVVEVG